MLHKLHASFTGISSRYWFSSLLKNDPTNSKIQAAFPLAISSDGGGARTTHTDPLDDELPGNQADRIGQDINQLILHTASLV